MAIARDFWRKYLPLIGVALFAYLLIKFDIRKIFLEISGMDLRYVAIIIPLVIIEFFIQTSKWWVIAKKQKINVPFFKAFKINITSGFYGAITPSRIGTITRAKFLKDYSSTGKGVSNFVLDKVLDVASLLFMAIFSGFLLEDLFGISAIIYFSIIFFIILILTLVFLKKERAKYLLKFFYRKFLPEKAKEKAKITFNAFYEDIPSKRFLLFAFILNLINWIFLYFTTYIIGKSIGINLPFYYYLPFLSIGTLVAQIPISINGLGTREAVLISLFGLFGIQPEKIFSMSLISLFFTAILPAIIAICMLYLENRKYQKNNVHLFFGCSEIKSSKLQPHSKERGFNFGHKKDYK